MLKFQEEEWGKRLIDNDLHKMFVLFWEESLSHDTPDTWQTRTSNIKTVLQEIMEAVDVAHEHEKYKHNIPVLISEANQLVGFDPVIRSHYPILRKLLPPEKSDLPLAEIRQRSVVILERLQGYQESAISDLRSLLALGDEKKKSELNYLAMAVAVGWSSIGYSRQYLLDGLLILLDDRIPEFLDRFDKFVNRYDGIQRPYRCTFALTWPRIVEFNTFQPADALLFNGQPMGPHCSESAKLYGNATDQEVFIQVSVDALDPIAAGRMGEEKIATMFAAINLYSVHRKFDFKGKGGLVKEGCSMPLFVPIERARRAQVKTSSNPALQTTRFFAIQRGLDHVDKDQIRSALQYHLLSLVASTDESRLVNFWIAMECIARRANQPIIEVICERIAPSVAIKNVSKQVDSLIRYTASLWNANKNENSRVLFPNSGESNIDAADMLNAILDKKDGPLISELFRLASGNPLACYRIYRFRKHMLTPKAATEMMVNHERNVNWQLRRIYRARNNLIHRGKRSQILHRLIQHLHEYFVTAMTNLIDDLGANPQWRTADALAYRSFLFSQYVQAISGKGNLAITRRALLDPTVLLKSNPSDALAWGAPAGQFADLVGISKDRGPNDDHEVATLRAGLATSSPVQVPQDTPRCDGAITDGDEPDGCTDNT